MMSLKMIKTYFLLPLVMILACTHEHSHEQHDPHLTDKEEMEHEADVVHLTKLQAEKIKLELGHFEEKNLRATIKVNGQLELPPQNKADVSAIVPGKITRILVLPGQPVKKGTVLAYLQNPEFIDWQQAYLETVSTLNFLEKEWERQKELVQKEIAPQRKLDQIESERAVSQAKLKGWTSKLKLLGLQNPGENLISSIRITSPLNGFVREIKANTGRYVPADQSLFEIVDNHHLHIDLKVFEKDLPFIKEGQTINFSLQSQPDLVMQAEIFAIGKALDEAERTVDVHAEINENQLNLLPGMFVEARIITENKKVSTLPEEAITTDKGLQYIFIKDGQEENETHFRKVAVLTGVTDLGYVEVSPLEELPPGAEIVTKSAYFLMAQSKKGEEGAGGHHH